MTFTHVGIIAPFAKIVKIIVTFTRGNNRSFLTWKIIVPFKSSRVLGYRPNYCYSASRILVISQLIQMTTTLVTTLMHNCDVQKCMCALPSLILSTEDRVRLKMWKEDYIHIL